MVVNWYIPKGNVIHYTVFASWTTATNVFGVLATDASFPVMMWGYCIAPDYGNLASL